MIKKLFLGTMAATLMFATSCQSELDAPATPANGEATVTVNLDIPQQMNSRSFSDGKTANRLQYGVYEMKDDVLTLVAGESAVGDAAETIDLQTTVQLKLMTGHKYALVFWADAGKGNSPYTAEFTQTGASVTANYAGVASNNENLDAFFAYQTIDVTGDMSIEAHLFRPFAQINIGTNDLAAVSNKEVKMTVKVSDVYTKLDLVTGLVSEKSSEPVTFAEAVIPEDQTFPVLGYEYLAMNYVLVGQNQTTDPEKALVNVEFTIAITGDAPDTRKVGNVPVQRNYRTNIYGQILTSNVDVKVIIEPDYKTPNNEYEYTDLDLLADQGGEIVLSSDINVDHNIVMTQDATIDLNGYKITTSDDVTVTIGELVSRAGGEPAKVTIKGSAGTVTAPLVVDGGELTIAGGYYSPAAGSDAASITVKSSGKLIILGGAFEGEGVIAGDITTDNVTIEGGIFKDFEPDGFVPEEKKDEVTVAPENTTLVRADNLAAAIKAGGNLLLIEDIEITEKIALAKSPTNIDFGGKTITNTKVGGDAIQLGGGTFTFRNGTIDNTIGGNAGIYANSSKGNDIVLENMNIIAANPVYLNNAAGPKCTIKSGNYTCTGANGEAVYVQNGGKVLIEGGTFSNPNATTYKTFLLNIKDEIRYDEKARPTLPKPNEIITVTGGTFINWNPADNAAEGKGTTFVAEGYNVVSDQVGDDIHYTVVPN